MKFLSSVAALIAAAYVTASPVPTSVPAPTKPDPSQVYVQSITYGGSGCPQGSVATSISDDAQTFTLIFDQFIASVGPKVPLTESRKNCQLNINLHIPSGWQYSIATADYRGFVQLDPKLVATQKSIYYFQGEVAQVSAGTDFTGPANKDYLVHDEIPFESTVWSPCGVIRPINANTQIRIDTTKNPNGSGQMTTDSIDGKVTHKLGFTWMKC